MVLRSPVLLTLQICVVLSGLAILAFSPPARGNFLLVPWSGRVGSAVHVAVDHGARLLGTGPLPGSLIVHGDRAHLAPAARSAGVFILAAPFAGCGSPAEANA